MEPLRLALVQRGPVAVSVAAADWDVYHSGIYDSCSADAVPWWCNEGGLERMTKKMFFLVKIREDIRV